MKEADRMIDEIFGESMTNEKDEPELRVRTGSSFCV